MRPQFLLLLAALAGCSDAKPKPVTPPTPDYARLQAEVLVRIIDSAARTGDWKEFDKHCDLEEFTRRVIGSAVVSYEVRMALRDAIQGDVERYPGFISPPRNEIRDMLLSGTVRFLRMREVDGRPRPLCRIVTLQAGLTYCEWILADDRSSRPRVIDAYSSAHGELLSALCRGVYLPRPDRMEVVNSLKAPMMMDLYSVFPERFRLIELVRDGKHSEVLEFFDAHREALGKDRIAQQSRLAAALTCGAERFLRAFEEFEAAFPGDPSLPMIRVRYLGLSGKFDEALEVLGQVDRALGGDVYMDAIRANLHREAGRMEKAAE